jgi:hypothetical protein
MNLISKLGQNIQFVAFCAHLFAAAFIVERFHSHKYIAMAVVIIAAALKEYLYDAREEKDPPQTLLDNTEDFIGWALGAMIGALIA